jgi:TonB family protein
MYGCAVSPVSNILKGRKAATPGFFFNKLMFILVILPLIRIKMSLNWISFLVAPLLLLFAEEVPQFKGGKKGLDYFITRNIVYPVYSQQNCIQGTVQVRFRLNPAGRVYDSAVEKGYGTDLDDEALRVVRMTSGKWTVPASYDTTQFIVMPINFSLREYGCDARSSDDINAAITAYKARQSLIGAVLNFYDKRSTGNFTREDELHIEGLKAQLGFDDKFYAQVVRAAQQKLKQGDRQGACEDLNFVKKLGSTRADDLLKANCL